jgi:hypothetical protein
LCSKNGDPDERQGSRRPGGRKIEVAGPIRGPPGEQKRLAPLKYISEWPGGGRVPVVWGTCSSGLTADLLGSCSARAGSPLPSPGSSISVGALAPAGTARHWRPGTSGPDYWGSIDSRDGAKKGYLLTPDTRGAFRLIEPPSLPPQPQTTGRPQTHHHHRHRRRAITVPSTFTRLVVFSSPARRSAARCLCFCRPPIGENF